MKMFRCFALQLILVPAVTGAATYYVSPSGADNNAGTLAAPFQTLMRAAQAAGPGDTVIVRDGTYGHVNAVTDGDTADTNASPVVFTRSGTAQAFITFRAEHKWAAVLDCQMICDSYFDLSNASYIAIQDFTITNSYREGIHSNGAAHDIIIRGNQIEYIGNRPTSTTYGLDGLYTGPNCHDFTIDGNVFHDIGRTNVNWLDHGLYLRGSNFTIVNNIFYNLVRGWAIQLADGLTNVMIADNTFAFPNPNRDGQIMLWNTQSGVTIRNNIFYSPLNIAITRYQSSVSACAIDHNLVFGTSTVISDATGCIVGNNLMNIDPKFANTVSPPYDFHLLQGSPAAAAGLSVPGVDVDFDGLPRPAASASIGALQYVTADWHKRLLGHKRPTPRHQT